MTFKIFFSLTSYSELVHVNRPVPVCLFEISEDGTGPSIGEMLVRKGLGVSSKQLSRKAIMDVPFIISFSFICVNM